MKNTLRATLSESLCEDSTRALVTDTITVSISTCTGVIVATLYPGDAKILSETLNRHLSAFAPAPIAS